jgi:NitT/TauT family transport system permease protein
MLVFVALIVVWEFLARYVATAPNSLLPGPAKVVVALRDALPELWRGTVASLLILVPGFALATVLGVLLGLRVGTSERSRRAFLPFVRVAAPVPPTVHIPYAIAVLPTFRTSAIFVVFIGAFWPIFINALGGAHSLDARYRDNARILGLGVAELFGANAGLGRFVQDYADFADYPKMVGGILYTGLVTFLAMTLLDWARRRALFWLR